MAFGTALNADDEEQKKQDDTAQWGGTPAPAASGFAAPTATQTAAAPAKTQSQGGGSGFVNLGRYANNSAVDKGAKVGGLANGFLSAEKGTFDAAAQPLRDAKSQWASKPTTDYLEYAFNSSGNDDKLKNLANAKWDGPTSVNYDPNASGNFGQIRNLLDPNSVFDSTFGDQAKTQSIGNSMLDNALFRSDQGVANAQNQARTDSGAFLNDASTEQKALADKGAGLVKESDEIRNTTRDFLQNKNTQLLAGVDSRVNAANAREQADAMNGTFWDPVAQKAIDGKGTVTDGWHTGSGGANRGNMVGAQSSQFARLADLLGDPNLAVQSTGAYDPGYWYAKQDMDAIPMLEASQYNRGDKNSAGAIDRQWDQASGGTKPPDSSGMWVPSEPAGTWFNATTGQKQQGIK